MKLFVRASILSIIMIVVFGFVYSFGVLGLSKLIFPKQANGSIIKYNGKEVGSELIGQTFSNEKFFHGRISAINYNTYDKDDPKGGGIASGSENLGSSNPKLIERVKKDIDEFLKTHPGVKKEDIPTDLLTASASGLDPHISPKAAKIQIPAISKATGISENELQKIVDRCTEHKTMGTFGEDGVNVLKSNIEIQKILDNK